MIYENFYTYERNSNEYRIFAGCFCRDYIDENGIGKCDNLYESYPFEFMSVCYVTETSTCEDKADGLSAVACFKFKNLTWLSKPQNDFNSDVRT